MSLRRPSAAITALAVAALLAGCGTASSSSSGSTTAGSSTTSTDAFNPNLVPAGGSSPGAPPKAPKTKSAKKTGAKPAGASHSGSASPQSSGAVSGGPSAGGAGPASGAGVAVPAGGGTRTVTVTHTSTVTHTVTKTKYVRPSVPSGAGLPSRSRALSVGNFDAARGNIGCRISNGTVRCDIAHRVWRSPARPRSCHGAWAPGMMVGSSGSAFFVCARNSVLDPTGTYIHPGYDDKVGSVTCQVRSFGVTCFGSHGRGFFIGRTGYTRF